MPYQTLLESWVASDAFSKKFKLFLSLSGNQPISCSPVSDQQNTPIPYRVPYARVRRMIACFPLCPTTSLAAGNFEVALKINRICFDGLEETSFQETSSDRETPSLTCLQCQASHPSNQNEFYLVQLTPCMPLNSKSVSRFFFYGKSNAFLSIMFAFNCP